MSGNNVFNLNSSICFGFNELKHVKTQLSVDAVTEDFLPFPTTRRLDIERTKLKVRPRHLRGDLLQVAPPLPPGIPSLVPTCFHLSPFKPL